MSRLVAAAQAALARVFRSLLEANFRRYFAGQAVSVIGTWTQRVAQDWLVLELSGSGVALGVSMVLQFGPTLLLGLWGGTVVDRVDRRRLLVATQSVQALLAALLGGLAIAGVVQLWMVYALALALGVVTVLDNPARQALVGEMVRPADYVNAQSLTSTVHNTGRLVGPAIAGLLIATTGIGVAFLVNAVSFLAVLVGLLRMDPGAPRATRGGRRKGSAREGLRYVRRTPDLWATLLLVGVVGLFGQNFRVVLPLLAQDTFHGGPEVYAYLTAALGLGAVVGALVTASRETATSWGMLLACRPSGRSTRPRGGRAGVAPCLRRDGGAGRRQHRVQHARPVRPAAGQRPGHARAGARIARSGVPRDHAVGRAAAGVDLRGLRPARGVRRRRSERAGRVRRPGPPAPGAAPPGGGARSGPAPMV